MTKVKKRKTKKKSTRPKALPVSSSGTDAGAYVFDGQTYLICALIGIFLGVFGRLFYWIVFSK